MDEAFLGNNDRLLQGVNLNFDAALDGGNLLLEEIHLNVLGSRLRNVETSITERRQAHQLVENSPVEKFLAAPMPTWSCPSARPWRQLPVHFRQEGLFRARNPSRIPWRRIPASCSGRGGFDLAIRQDAKNWNSDCRPNSPSPRMIPTSSVAQPTASINSPAARRFRFARPLARGIQASGPFAVIRRRGLHPERGAYRNELAQTPSFVGERIMNIENDSTVRRTNDRVRARNYSTFDAMYGHVFKFAPSAATESLAESAPSPRIPTPIRS